MKYNIIFLDIDGVLNNAHSMMAGPFVLFDPATINRLKEILTLTDSRIVLSTAWRNNASLKRILINELERKGINRKLIIGQTPDLSIINKKRSDEIIFWITKNRNIIKNWVAIDDIDLLKLPRNNVVKTNLLTGLTDKLTGEVISKIIFN
jgi:hypothetical protein